MRQDKPAIRAPRISLQQELIVKQQEPAVASFEGILPADSSTISAGDFLSSLFSRHFIVTIAALVILAAVVYAVDSFNHWSKTRSRPHHSTAVPFELPPEIENTRVPVSDSRPAFDSKAEAYYIEGNKLMVSGFAHRAEKMFRQAAEANPNDQKYWIAWQAVRREADFDTFRRQMDALLAADRDNEAWEAYVNGVRRDRRFFHRYTPDFAESLVKAGHLASAASVLMTFNELYPVNAKTRQQLEKIRSMP